MSSADDAHGSDAHDAHTFTGEPVQELAPDEPRTPGWLPVLGVVLFTAATVIFLAGRTTSSTTTGSKADGSANPAPSPSAAVVRPSGSPPTTVQVTPEQAGRVRKALDAH
jgi:hypothetical protein